MRHVGHGARRRRWADLGLGGTSRNGRLLVSWIHDIEFVNALDRIITCEHITGAINRASPGRRPNAAFRLEIGAIILGTETELCASAAGWCLDDCVRMDFPSRSPRGTKRRVTCAPEGDIGRVRLSSFQSDSDSDYTTGEP